jgi:DNA-binding LytR/AlgR family response regulator
MNTATPTALIAEDEPLLAQWLATELAERWPALRVVAQAEDGTSAIEQALAQRPQVCFLDIRMPGHTGLEAAQAIAEDWPADVPLPLFVFVTAYEQFALQAFEAQAVDYLVKPVDSVRLDDCIARLKTRLVERQAAPAGALVGLEQLRALLAQVAPPAQQRLQVIQAQSGNLVTVVPVDEVIYFEAADKYVRVVTRDKEHLIRMSLRELLPQLDGERFWQVHRGTVVQARCITQARREESGKVALTLHGRPEQVTVSRLYAHLFRGM